MLIHQKLMFKLKVFKITNQLVCTSNRFSVLELETEVYFYIFFLNIFLFLLKVGSFTNGDLFMLQEDLKIAKQGQDEADGGQAKVQGAHDDGADAERNQGISDQEEAADDGNQVKVQGDPETPKQGAADGDDGLAKLQVQVFFI